MEQVNSSKLKNGEHLEYKDYLNSQKEVNPSLPKRP